MSIFTEYLNYYVYGIDNTIVQDKIISKLTIENKSEKKYLITINELNSVNLNPVKDVIPGPSRNMPSSFDKVNLQNLNKAQLQQILNVKLKPIIVKEKILFYEPRHPVLYELTKKFKSNEFFKQ